MADEQLIEKMASVMARDDDPMVIEMYRALARDALAVARPIIEAQERERIMHDLPAQSAMRKLEEQHQEIERLREALKNARDESRDAWRRAASSSLGKHESARILRDRWRESAQQAFDVATSDPQTAEQWRAFGNYECGMAYADEIDPDVE